MKVTQALSYAGLFATELAVLGGVQLSTDLQMLLLAVFTITIAAHGHADTPEAERREEPGMTASEAAQLPLYAGGVLVGLYLAFKWLNPAWVNLLLKAYFLTIGVGAVAAAALPLLTALLPVPRLSHAFARLPTFGLTDSGHLPVTALGVVATALGGAAAAWYGLTNHWLSNNALALCMCLSGGASINVGSVRTGALLLSGLFVYDIAMVHGTGTLLGPHRASIMEEVAVKVDGPIKLLFPLPAAEAAGRSRPFGMLGLGDIIVPCVFLALLLRFDVVQAEKAAEKAAEAALAKRGKGGQAADAAVETASNPPARYFNCALLAYVVGLMTTSVAMHHFETAQPALLFLVPAVLAAPALLALARGEFATLWAFDEDAPQPGKEAAGGADASGDKAAGPAAADSAAPAATAADGDAEPAVGGGASAASNGMRQRRRA